MQGIVCDRCGDGLLIESNVRYRLEVRMQAAYDPMEITREDLDQDLEQAMAEALRDLDQKSTRDAEREVHFEGNFDLCARCQKEFLSDKLFR